MCRATARVYLWCEAKGVLISRRLLGTQLSVWYRVEMVELEMREEEKRRMKGQKESTEGDQKVAGID